MASVSVSMSTASRKRCCGVVYVQQETQVIHGIMTLGSNMTGTNNSTLRIDVASDIKKMSLFQDLKLKRRKVDSHGSSDGEAPEPSTSSPECLSAGMGEGGPPTPVSLAPPVRSGNSTDDRPSPTTSPVGLLKERLSPRAIKCEPDLQNHDGIVNGCGPKDSNNGVPHSNGRSHSDDSLHSSNNNGNSSDGVFDGGGRSGDSNRSSPADTKPLPPPARPSSAPHQNGFQELQLELDLSKRKQQQHAATNGQNHHHSDGSPTSSGVPTPSHTPTTSPNPPPAPSPTICQPQAYWQAIPYRINGVRPELISGGYVNGQRASQSQGASSPVDKSSSSSSSSSTSSTSSACSTRLRTPTVIMGEAGGVRTMVWSQPGQNIVAAGGGGAGGSGSSTATGNGTSASNDTGGALPPPSPASFVELSRASGGSSPSPERLRLSVDGLLSLGQDGPPPPPPPRRTPSLTPLPLSLPPHAAHTHLHPLLSPGNGSSPSGSTAHSLPGSPSPGLLSPAGYPLSRSVGSSIISAPESPTPSSSSAASQHFNQTTNTAISRSSVVGETVVAQTTNHVQHQQQQQPRSFPPLDMGRLWAGDLAQLPPLPPPASSQASHNSNNSHGLSQHQHQSHSSQQQQQQQHPHSVNSHTDTQQALNLSWGSRNGGGSGANDARGHDDDEEEEQPMICMICEDKATGLHYGIITCEGCKGFFKRTVQNRRVYTCVADGNCEITKAGRNRCQYCRFKKCIEQGMVLQAVREDRMPGGRNSGAVYNLYKVKYKKHKKAPKNGQIAKQERPKGPGSGSGVMMSVPVGGSSETTVTPLINGTILKTALTNPSEVVHLRQRLDGSVSSSRDRSPPLEATIAMIRALIECDEFEDIATLRNLEELMDHRADLSDKLCQIGDNIVFKLVQWTKRLPFYPELPVEVHTHLLTHKWHELLVLTTAAYQAIHGSGLQRNSAENSEAEFAMEVQQNLRLLQNCLTSMMGRPVTLEQLRQDVGLMVEKITHVTRMFRCLALKMEEYVCLKVIVMVNQAKGEVTELEAIRDRYMGCLRSFVEATNPPQTPRFQNLLNRLPEVQAAASLLLESKMFYVPFLLNSTIQR